MDSIVTSNGIFKHGVFNVRFYVQGWCMIKMDNVSVRFSPLMTVRGVWNVQFSLVNIVENRLGNAGDDQLLNDCFVSSS